MSVGRLDERSCRQSWDRILDAHCKLGVHYVDNDLVVAIIDIARASFVTCFHEHFDRRRPLRGNNPGRSVSVAQSRLRYLDDLRIKEKGRLIINLRILRDGPPKK